MNYTVPDFQDSEEDYSVSNSFDFSRDKRPATGEEDIMEMLWQNGQVVLQSQKQRPAKRTAGGSEVVTPAEREIRSNGEEMHLFMQEDEMASWLQYPLEDSSLDREFYADLLYSAAPPTTPVSLPPPFAVAEIRPLPATPRLTLPPPAVARPENLPRFQNFVHFSRIPSKPRPEPVQQSLVTSAIESNVVESCETPVLRPEIGVNFQATADSKALMNVESYTDLTAGASAVAGDMATSTCELTTTSSPGGSGSSFIASVEARQPRRKSPPPTEDRKRKGRESDDAECQSEQDVGFEGAEGKKQLRGSSSSTKRSRAAEVHNLSERRRRDRINEKMKALQELIPRCNKSDKASMLDEAIEYLKSLQLQVQMMSMGCGMVPMMYPGMQQYMPHMGMGMGMGMDIGMNRPLVPYPPMIPGSSMPSPAAAVHMGPRFPMPSPFPMPRVPQSDPSRIQALNHNDPGQNSGVSNTPTQPMIPNFADPYQQHVGIHQPQLSVPKACQKVAKYPCSCSQFIRLMDPPYILQNQEMNPACCEQTGQQQRNRKP